MDNKLSYNKFTDTMNRNNGKQRHLNDMASNLREFLLLYIEQPVNFLCCYKIYLFKTVKKITFRNFKRCRAL